MPKTAGTTITRSLGALGIMLGGERNSRSIYFKQAQATFLRDALGGEFQTYYRFGFVRNPWDWCVSNYEFNRGMHKPYRKGTRYDVPNYIKGKGYIVPPEILDINFETWLPWWLGTLQPQMIGMMSDESGELLVEDIFRFESLDRDFNTIRTKLGIAERDRLPHVNKTRSRQKHYSRYYSDHCRALVRDYFSKEIEAFDYAFR